MARNRVVGSLTKEFPLSDVDETIRLARDGMKYERFRNLAKSRTHPDIPALVVNRFLLQRGDVLVYDRFLSLAASEGLATPRMRKIMYATWALRDSRLRRFIAEVIADENGLWRPNQVSEKKNAAFFEKFFAKSTTTKVRSNIEYFLQEAGIFKEGSVRLDLTDGWLPEAVRVAAQHQTNANMRRTMASDPIGYILANDLNALANATKETLRSLSLPADPEAEVVEDDELSVSGPTQSRSRRWNRTPPVYTGGQGGTIPLNSVARERAGQAHFRLEKLLVSAARTVACDPKNNDHIDVFFAAAGSTVLAEVKSCRRTNLHSQVRRGVSQLLEYAYVYASTLKSPVQKLLVLEIRPVGAQAWLIEYLLGLDISVAWASLDGLRLESISPIPECLSGIIHSV